MTPDEQAAIREGTRTATTEPGFWRAFALRLAVAAVFVGSAIAVFWGDPTAWWYPIAIAPMGCIVLVLVAAFYASIFFPRRHY